MSTHKISRPIVTDGLLLYWDPLNVRSYTGGTTLKNLIDDNLATFFGGTPAYNNGVYTFTSAQLLYTTANGGANTDSFTFSIWCNPTLSTDNAMAFTRGLDGAGTGWNIGIGPTRSAGRAQVFVTTMSTGAALNPVAISTSVITPNKWWHITGVWNAGVSLKCYINGILETTTAVTSTILRNSTVSWAVGHYSTTLTPRWAGLMGPCMAYNRVLTDAEVLQNYNAGRGRFGL